VTPTAASSLAIRLQSCTSFSTRRRVKPPRTTTTRLLGDHEILFNEKAHRIDGTKVGDTWYRGLYDDVRIPDLPELGVVAYDAICEDTGQRQGRLVKRP
jgi:hypothetical protein